MATARKDVVKRLKTLPAALETTAADICRRTGIKPNAWSQYIAEDGKRKITLAAANRLCDEFKLSLDWIYRGDTSGLQGRLIEKLRKAA